jgi:hypothetical protein
VISFRSTVVDIKLVSLYVDRWSLECARVPYRRRLVGPDEVARQIDGWLEERGTRVAG